MFTLGSSKFARVFNSERFASVWLNHAAYSQATSSHTHTQRSRTDPSLDAGGRGGRDPPNYAARTLRAAPLFIKGILNLGD